MHISLIIKASRGVVATHTHTKLQASIQLVVVAAQQHQPNC